MDGFRDGTEERDGTDDGELDTSWVGPGDGMKLGNKLGLSDGMVLGT